MPKKNALYFFALLLVLLSSCENFMKGSGVKDELSKLVEEANAPEVELYIACDPKYGVVAPSGYVSYKKGQSFNLVFLENPGYQFAGWQVQDKTSLQQVQGALAFENPTAKETKAKLLSSTKNLYISPVCLELPQVESFYPSEIDNGVFANTPIRIKFNIAVQFPDQQMTGRQLVKVMQIYPLVQGEPVDISDYYNLPLLSEDEKTITLTPKAQELSAYIQNQNMEKLIRVKVSLNADINAMVNGKALYRYVPDNTDDAFYYRVNPHVEDTPPEKINFFVTRDELLYDELSASDTPSLSGFTPLESGVLEGTALSEVQAESVYSRMAGQYIYFYGEYKDTDSGFDSILVEEKFVNTKEGIPSPDKDWVRGDTSGLVKWDTATGGTRFILKYKIKSDDGAINLKITPYDFCGNQSPSHQYTIFKSTRIGLENVEPFNWLGGEVSEDATFNNIYLFDQEYPEYRDILLKTIRIAYENLSTQDTQAYDMYIKGHELKEKLYKDVYLPENYYSVYCEYMGRSKPEKMELVEEEIDNKIKSWQLPLNVTSTEGLEFTVSVYDALGNYEQRSYQFPGRPAVVTKKDNIVFFTSDYPFTQFVHFGNGEHSLGHFHLEGNSCAINNSYIACKNGNLLGYPEIPDVDLEFTDNTTPDVILSSLPAEKGSGIQILTLDIPESFWSNNGDSRYDSIFVMYRTGLKKDSEGNEIWNITEFEDSALSCSFNVETTDLYMNGITADIFGKKGNTITKLAYFPGEFRGNSQLVDNAPPSFKHFSSNLESYLFDMEFCSESLNYETYILHPEISDVMSGLDYVEWWTEDNQIVNRLYKTPEDDSLELLLPNWDMDLNRERVHLKAVDKKENVSFCDYTVDFHNDVIQLYSKDPTGMVKEFDRRKFYSPNQIQYLKTKLAITSIDGLDDLNVLLDYDITEGLSLNTNCFITDLSIGNLDDILLAVMEEDPDKEDYYFEVGEAIKNRFLKFVMLAQTDDNNPHGADYYYGISDPVYCYVGDFPAGKTGSGYALWFDNGGLISSDMPVYVETLVTKKSKTECEHWSIQEWQHHRMHRNPVYVNCSDIELYEIYEADYEDIESGSCYVLVAHFCDGSTKKSPVYQR